MNDDLLLRLQALDNIDRDLENIGDNVGRCESQPLREGYIGDTSRLVDFDKGQVLCCRGILNVMACQELVSYS